MPSFAVRSKKQNRGKSFMKQLRVQRKHVGGDARTKIMSGLERAIDRSDCIVVSRKKLRPVCRSVAQSLFMTGYVTERGPIPPAVVRTFCGEALDAIRQREEEYAGGVIF